MKITKSYNEKELLLTVEGRIDTHTSQELEDAINDEFENFESLTLDFADIEYISSAGLRVLISTQKN